MKSAASPRQLTKPVLPPDTAAFYGSAPRYITMDKLTSDLRRGAMPGYGMNATGKSLTKVFSIVNTWSSLLILYYDASSFLIPFSKHHWPPPPTNSHVNRKYPHTSFAYVNLTYIKVSLSWNAKWKSASGCQCWYLGTVCTFHLLSIGEVFIGFKLLEWLNDVCRD